MSAPAPGQRLYCAQCGTEVVVVKAPGEIPSCCGQAMNDLSQKGAGVGQ